jgi:hypothetical protein
VAAYDFDADEKDAESLSVAEFTVLQSKLLNEWRSRVVEAGGATRDTEPAAQLSLTVVVADPGYQPPDRVDRVELGSQGIMRSWRRS